MIIGLNHLTLAVGDVDRSFDFYVALLGCRPEARWGRGAYLSAGDLWLCLSLDEPRPAGDYTHVAFSVASGAFADAVSRLTNAGVRRWKDNTSEGESFYFLDPDGHKLELHDGDLASRLAAVEREPYAPSSNPPVAVAGASGRTFRRTREGGSGEADRKSVFDPFEKPKCNSRDIVT